jgi:hypothetical protein
MSMSRTLGCERPTSARATRSENYAEAAMANMGGKQRRGHVEGRAKKLLLEPKNLSHYYYYYYYYYGQFQ